MHFAALMLLGVTAIFSLAAYTSTNLLGGPTLCPPRVPSGAFPRQLACQNHHYI